MHLIELGHEGARLFLLLRSIIRGTELLLEEVADKLFVHLFLFLIFLFIVTLYFY